MTASIFDARLERLVAGGRLEAGEIRDLAASPDILALGMLADAVRRRLHGTRTTYVRVAPCAFDASFADAVPPAAREVQLIGTPDTLAIAVSAVTSARAVAGSRTVSGFSWADIARLGDGAGGVPRVLEALRGAGLDAVAALPLDAIDAAAAVAQLADAGFTHLRLTIDRAPAGARTGLLLEAAALQDRFGCIQAIDPLPAMLDRARPTTGYEDAKMVAVARLAAPNISSVQVDWQRYGPKLAQVALSFGADDLYGVSPFDEAPEGRRRAPVAEVRRNIEAAGFVPAERDGAYTVVP